MAEQAERAGRIIKSVHHFVRRRDASTRRCGADQLVDAVMPLVRLQARKERHPRRARPAGEGAARRLRPHDDGAGAAQPHRNGIQAMEEHRCRGAC